MRQPQGDAPSGRDGLRQLGILIDLSEDLERPDGIDLSLRRAEALLASEEGSSFKGLLHYFAANAWEVRRKFAYTDEARWSWDQPELGQIIVHLRHAARLADETVSDVDDETTRAAVRDDADSDENPDVTLDESRRCQIYTNLGNHMSHCGRLFDAVTYWDRALEIDSGFPMAMANRGYGFLQLVRLTDDGILRAAYVREAHSCLKAALGENSRERLHEDARDFFQRQLDDLEKRVPRSVLEARPHRHDFPKRISRAERRYRQWALEERLFLNGLNEVRSDAYAARDTLALPGLTRRIIDGPPTIIGIFNQLKQEYASARYLYYCGVTATRPHFSDRQVTLVDTLDYPSYGFAGECIRAAYRLAYSLFDKLAFCLNEYFHLNIPERAISFRSLWVEKQTATNGIRKEIYEPRNKALMGLYWISKDLFEKDRGFIEALEPDAAELAEIRNHLEHKYLKLHMFGVPEVPTDSAETPRLDPLCFSVDRGEFELKTLRLLRTVRSALLHLVQSVHIAEALRAQNEDAGSPLPSIPLFFVDDRFKV